LEQQKTKATTDGYHRRGISAPGFWLLFCLVACFPGPTQAAAQQSATPPGRPDDWRIACAGDGYCFAASRDPESGALLRIGRAAEGVYWEISFQTAGPPPDPARPLTATVDGRALTFQIPASLAPFGRRDDFFFLGKPAQALLDRLVPGHRLEIGFNGTDGRPAKLAFALDGLAQGLIAIDTAQHRLGSERVAEAPPHGLFRADVLGAGWMEPALAHYL